MNESILEYIKLKQYLHDLYQRQGANTWPILQRTVEDLAQTDEIATSMTLARQLALQGLQEAEQKMVK